MGLRLSEIDTLRTEPLTTASLGPTSRTIHFSCKVHFNNGKLKQVVDIYVFWLGNLSKK